MAISLVDQQPTMGTTASQQSGTGSSLPWKSYSQYFAGNPDAQKWSHYQSKALPGSPEAQAEEAMDWGSTGNPYRFSQEYNQYKSTLPQTYRDLINYGISPEMVASGQIKGILGSSGVTPIPMPGTPGATGGSNTAGSGQNYGEGSGSSFSLSPDVLKKMWR
jgi:hypothetical protein